MDTSRPYFFVHVMKTGGTTFVQHMRNAFPADRMYPDPQLDGDPLTAYTSVAQLTALPAERLASLGAVSGHFPYAAVPMSGLDATAITILREPVARTISHLRQFQRDVPRFSQAPLEAIYEDLTLFTTHFWNHQVKVFAFTAADAPDSFRDVLEVTPERERIAREQLAQVDVVGLAHRQQDVLDELERRFGWSFSAVEPRRVAGHLEVPESLTRQIAEDNQADLEFWEFACELVEQRRT